MSDSQVDFEQIAATAQDRLRKLWKATSSPAVRKELEAIASALDEIEGDRAFLAEQFEEDEQAAYREKILSY